MELDVPNPIPPATANAANTLPSLFAGALPPGLEFVVERLENYARAAQGAFADDAVRALTADSEGRARDAARHARDCGCLY